MNKYWNIISSQKLMVQPSGCWFRLNSISVRLHLTLFPFTLIKHTYGLIWSKGFTQTWVGVWMFLFYWIWVGFFNAFTLQEVHLCLFRYLLGIWVSRQKYLISYWCLGFCSLEAFSKILTLVSNIIVKYEIVQNLKKKIVVLQLFL